MRAEEREAEVLTVGPTAFQAMLSHATREEPREAVGMLAGNSPDVASLALPLVNLAGPGAFLADPYSQYLAEKRISAEELKLLAIYHSHPGGGAHLSETDLEFASLRDIINIVIAPPHGDCSLDARAYRVQGEKVICVNLRLLPGRRTGDLACLRSVSANGAGGQSDGPTLR
jgi:proteasome lid subunit RPN8/RPN11